MVRSTSFVAVLSLSVVACSGLEQAPSSTEPLGRINEPLPAPVSTGGLPTMNPFFDPNPDNYAQSLDQTRLRLPLLHSNSTAGSVVYLDYDGSPCPSRGECWGSNFDRVGTSQTTLSLSTGVKSLTTQANLGYVAGGRVRLIYIGPDNNAGWMQGIVQSYNSSSGQLGINIDQTRGGIGTCGPPSECWRIDAKADTQTFSFVERANILEGWRQSAMRFAAFDIDVSTDFGVLQDGRPRSWLSMDYNGGGGENFVGFPNDDAPGSIADDSAAFYPGTAHEAGHSFGLAHNGTHEQLGLLLLGYAVSRSAVKSHLMGEAESHKISSWTDYPYYDSTSVPQFAMQQIASMTGWRTTEPTGVSDYADSRGAAQLLRKVDDQTWGEVGIINGFDDVDYFKWQPAAGTYSIVVGRDAPSEIDTYAVILSASGQILYSEDGDPSVVEGPNGINQPGRTVADQHFTAFFPAGTYYIAVGSQGNSGDLGQYVVRVNQLGTSANAWQDDDVGFVGVPGYSKLIPSSNTYVVAGSGGEIQHSGLAFDAFHYTYQRLRGDGTIVARVTTLNGSTGWSRAGIMLRESLNKGAKLFALSMSQAHGWLAEHRNGSDYQFIAEGSGIAPYALYLKIQRSGSTLTYSTSTNGTSYTQRHQITVSNLASELTLGLFSTDATATERNAPYRGIVASRITLERLTVGTMTNVSLTAGSGGALNPQPTVNTGLGVPTQANPTNVTHNGAKISWTPGSGSVTPTGYRVEWSRTGTVYDQFVDVGSTARDATISSLTQFDEFRFRVRALRNGAVSNPSGVRAVVTHAGPPLNIRTYSVATDDVAFDWVDASGEVEYRIYLDGVPDPVGINPANNTVFSSKERGLTLSSNTPYTFRVESVDSTGHATSSESFVVQTRWAASPPVWKTPTATCSQVTLSWNAMTGADTYRVYSRIEGRTLWSVVTNTTGTSATHLVSGSTDYRYLLVAGVTSGPGKTYTMPAPELQVITPACP